MATQQVSRESLRCESCFCTWFDIYICAVSDPGANIRKLGDFVKNSEFCQKIILFVHFSRLQILVCECSEPLFEVCRSLQKASVCTGEIYKKHRNFHNVAEIEILHVRSQSLSLQSRNFCSQYFRNFYSTSTTRRFISPNSSRIFHDILPQEIF